MRFKYQARTQEGETQVGYVEAADRDGAITILSNHNLYILAVENVDKTGFLDRLGGYFSRVTQKDVMVFSRQLATLLEARLPLNSALRTLEEQTSNKVLKEAIRQITDDVNSGLPFSQALARQEGIFSEFFISMIKSSEVIGNMDEAAGFLADYLEKESILSGKAKSALIYPSVIIALFIGVAAIMVTVVFPQIGPVFEQSGVVLPFYTKALLGIGAFMGKWWIAVLLSVCVSIILALNYLQTPEGRAFTDDLKVRLPILNKIYVPLTITRVANIMSMLLKGGVPVTQAVEIAGQTVNNVLYQDLLACVAEDVQQGQSLSSSLSKHPEYFPPLVSQMVVVGESTGQIDKMLARLAGFYSRQVDGVISNVVDLLQPLIMVVIGGLVGLLFASILLPMYQLTSSIQ
jgi:type IV pilus assembly protein PilC